VPVERRFVITLPPRWRLTLEWIGSAFWSRERKAAYAREVEETAAYFEQLSSCEARLAESASVGGRHFTQWVETVKQLKRQKRYAEAEALLMQLASAAESWGVASGHGTPPWYANQLRIVRKKLATQALNSKSEIPDAQPK